LHSARSALTTINSMSRKTKRKTRGGRGKPPRSRRPERGLKPVQEQRLQAARSAHAGGNIAYAEQECRALLAEGARTVRVFELLARICAATGRPDDAQRLWRKVLQLDPAHPDALLAEAQALERSGRTDEAIRGYRRILSRHPEKIVPRYLLANQLKARGALDEARDAYLDVISRQPDYTQAHFTYSGIHRYRDPDDPHLKQLLALHESGRLAGDGAIQVAFALAKAFEDLGDYARAFRYLEEGNERRYRKYDYRIDGDRELIENITETFSEDALAALDVPCAASDRPIFIVGMPRSGTSLVEKILASHPDVHGAGELEDFFSLAAGIFLDPALQYRFRPLRDYPRDAFARLGESYLERLGALDAGARRVTDKLPFNMMMVGLIRLALPNARIVHCVRDARDTGLSIYKQNFATENYRFAYRLQTIAQFHKLYARLMRHWHAVFPGDIYDVRYEALTSEPEAEIRGLLAACGLEWDDACLAFDRSEGVVRTASAWQVRQPIYTSSVRLWQKYGAALQPLLDELETDD
jgi:tetratricopeptide (TPR) repeat protein